MNRCDTRWDTSWMLLLCGNPMKSWKPYEVARSKASALPMMWKPYMNLMFDSFRQ